MLNSIISHIDTKLSDSGFIINPKGLAEFKYIDSDKKIPATFCNGEWTAIDIESEFTYHRINGTISFDELDEEQATSCDPWLRATFPIKYVFCQKKTTLDNSIYDASKVAFQLSMLLQTLNNKTLAIELGVDTFSVLVENSDTDVYAVYDSEFNTSEYPEDYVLISIDYNIELTGTYNCIDKICQNVQ